jgi:hypothetical protein
VSEDVLAKLKAVQRRLDRKAAERQKFEEAVARIVASAPPISDETLRRVADILRNAAKYPR